MSTEDFSALPAPEFAGGRGAITTTPIVGEPKREYRQARVELQPRPVPGIPRSEPTARPPAQPAWWAEALIPLDDVLALP